MTKTGYRSNVVVFTLCALIVTSMSVRAAEIVKSERMILNNLLAAVEANDYAAFLTDASPEVKAGITKQMLEGVSVQVAPHMQQGYEVAYFGNLTQQGCGVYLWKLTYRDKRDDTLAKLVIKDGQVAGFWLQ
jgi:hypothetical protein